MGAETPSYWDAEINSRMLDHYGISVTSGEETPHISIDATKLRTIEDFRAAIEIGNTLKVSLTTLAN